MKETLVGLVIRAGEWGDNGKLLTVLTAEGKRLVSVNGAKGIKSRFIATSQLFSYCEFQVEVKNNRTYLQDVALIENFYEIHTKPLRLALASYVCEIAQQVCVESADESEMLSLVLNMLYVLGSTEISDVLAKAAFEARVLVAQGIAPDMEGCRDCGGVFDLMYLDVMNGTMVCGDCLLREEDRQAGARQDTEDATARILLPIQAPVRQALEYLLTCPPKQLFRFVPDAAWFDALGRVTEAYMQNHLECRSFALPMYRELKKAEEGRKTKEIHETGKL